MYVCVYVRQKQRKKAQKYLSSFDPLRKFINAEWQHLYNKTFIHFLFNYLTLAVYKSH